ILPAQQEIVCMAHATPLDYGRRQLTGILTEAEQLTAIEIEVPTVQRKTSLGHGGTNQIKGHQIAQRNAQRRALTSPGLVLGTRLRQGREDFTPRRLGNGHPRRDELAGDGAETRIVNQGAYAAAARVP